MSAERLSCRSSLFRRMSLLAVLSVAALLLAVKADTFAEMDTTANDDFWNCAGRVNPSISSSSDSLATLRKPNSQRGPSTVRRTGWSPISARTAKRTFCHLVRCAGICSKKLHQALWVECITRRREMKSGWVTMELGEVCEVMLCITRRYPW